MQCSNAIHGGLCVLVVLAGCSATEIDFTCELPGDARVYVGEREYKLPATLTFTGDRDDLRFDLPTEDGDRLLAKGEIQFNSDYYPTDVDRYARQRAELTRELIRTVEDGGAAVFTGYSAAKKQEVFRLLFGKE